VGRSGSGRSGWRRRGRSSSCDGSMLFEIPQLARAYAGNDLHAANDGIVQRSISPAWALSDTIPKGI